MMGNSMLSVLPVTQQLYSDPACSPPLAELIIDKVARGIIFVDNDGFLVYMNNRAAEILQVHKETVIGKRVDMLSLRTPLYKVLSEQCSGAPLEMALKERVIAAQSTTIRDSVGEIRGEMTEVWDVTEERKSRRQWEEFVAMMAHDLRSPLTVVMGYIQGMLFGMYGEVGARIQEVLQKADESVARLNAMIEEMLDTYRLEVGLLNISRLSCNVGTILESCYLDNLQTARAQNITLLYTQKEAAPEVMVDSKQLSRAFNNLIGNAIKYTPGEGRVTVVLEVAPETLRITVSDTGIGIPPQDLSRIFYKYYRSEGTSGIKGTGLGLAISKAIIEAHGGTIEAESTPGSGSTFRVIIPVTTL